MKKSLIFSFILFVLLSCTKESEETWYGIQNKSGVDIVCSFYLKHEKSNNEIRIPVGESQNFYWQTGTHNSPVENISSLYDSVCISVLKTDSVKIFFSLTQVKNYKVNLFTEASAWKQKNLSDSRKTSFSTTKVSVNQYTFEINRDSISNF